MKKLLLLISIVLTLLLFSGCFSETEAESDVQKTLDIGNILSQNQPTPTDIEYSLERYNLIKRTYWVNGMREKARTLPCPIADIPFGYIVLLDHGLVVGKFVVEGKVTSLNSYLTPDSQYYSQGEGLYKNPWLPDVDGSYGYNDNGIFFFTPTGSYIEWTGTYLYSDIPFEINDPVLKVGGIK